MKDTISQFSRCCARINPHGSIQAILKRELQNSISKKRRMHFGVTDICNPLQTYYKLRYPQGFEDSVEKKRKFVLGNRQHWILQEKFKQIEGFEDNEITIDGRLLDIRLVGRIDSKNNGGIWEIKSKEELPTSVEELIEKHSQDIEQLCFYSIIDPSSPKENFLIFTTHHDAEKTKSFKITIKDLGKIKEVVLKRIEKLNGWLDTNDASKHNHKCRYCEENCSLRRDGNCNHFLKGDFPCEVSNFIEISEAPVLDRKLKNIQIYEEEPLRFPMYSLITPRKFFLRKMLDKEENYDNMIRNECSLFIQNLLYNNNMLISSKENKELNQSQKNPKILLPRKSFIKLNLAGDEKIYPLLIHINEKGNPLVNPSSYKIGELGLYCANNGLNKGYLLVYYPNQENEIKVYEVNYNFDKDSVKPIKEIIEILSNQKRDEILKLPACPSFMCSDCIYKEECVKLFGEENA